MSQSSLVQVRYPTGPHPTKPAVNRAESPVKWVKIIRSQLVDWFTTHKQCQLSTASLLSFTESPNCGLSSKVRLSLGKRKSWTRNGIRRNCRRASNRRISFLVEWKKSYSQIFEGLTSTRILSIHLIDLKYERLQSLWGLALIKELRDSKQFQAEFNLAANSLFSVGGKFIRIKYSSKGIL